MLGISLSDLKNYTFLETDYEGAKILVSRTGYTGEDGFELYFPNALAKRLWDQLAVLGEKYGVAPIGLGARDTLRLEMRMPLYGNDVGGEDITPYEAGLGGRFVKLDKGPFIGRAALQAQKETGTARKLIAFSMRGGKGIPRQGYALLSADGQEIGGAVTSGTHSPSLNHPHWYGLRADGVR